MQLAAQPQPFLRLIRDTVKFSPRVMKILWPIFAVQACLCILVVFLFTNSGAVTLSHLVNLISGSIDYKNISNIDEDAIMLLKAIGAIIFLFATYFQLIMLK